MAKINPSDENTSHSQTRREHSLAIPKSKTGISEQSLSLKDRIAQASTWGILLPCLCVWPFVSAFPAFSILSEASNITKLTVQAAFFATGFWALGTVAAVVFWVRLPADPAARSSKPSRLTEMIGAYSLVWLAAYAIAVWRGWA